MSKLPHLLNIYHTSTTYPQFSAWIHKPPPHHTNRLHKLQIWSETCQRIAMQCRSGIPSRPSTFEIPMRKKTLLAGKELYYPYTLHITHIHKLTYVLVYLWYIHLAFTFLNLMHIYEWHTRISSFLQTKRIKHEEEIYMQNIFLKRQKKEERMEIS